jgi:hypothetical protein
VDLDSTPHYANLKKKNLLEKILKQQGVSVTDAGLHLFLALLPLVANYLPVFSCMSVDTCADVLRSSTQE